MKIVKTIWIHLPTQMIYTVLGPALNGLQFHGRSVKRIDHFSGGSENLAINFRNDIPCSLRLSTNTVAVIPSSDGEPRNIPGLGRISLVPESTLIIQWFPSAADLTRIRFFVFVQPGIDYPAEISQIEQAIDDLMTDTDGGGEKRGPKPLGCNVWLEYMIHTKGYTPGHDPDSDKLYQEWLGLYEFEKETAGDWDNYTKAIRDIKDRRSN